MTNDFYFASFEQEQRVTINEIESKIASWRTKDYSGILSSTRSARTRNITAFYSAILQSDSSLTSLGLDGDDLEIVKVVMPEARKLTKDVVGIITKQRLYFETVTDAKDSNSLQTAKLGKGIANSLIDKFNLEKAFQIAEEKTFLTGQQFCVITWNTSKGYPYAANEQGGAEYSGDIEYYYPRFEHVVYDWKREFKLCDWCIVIRPRNKWDLIAQFPELKDELISASEVDTSVYLSDRVNYTQSESITDDYIYIKEFYHKPTPALPDGRMIFFLNSDVVFYDGENSYGKIPVEELAHSYIIDTGIGYPTFSDLLPVQEVLDGALSTIVTNQNAFGLRIMLNPRGNDLSVEQQEGLSFLNYKPMQGIEGNGKPTYQEFPNTPPEFFNFIESLRRYMESISSLNSAIRGNPPPGVTSGTAIATLTANAVEFLQDSQKDYAHFIERVMTQSIECYTRFATVPQIAEVTGSNLTYSQEFLGEQLKSIKKIKLRMQSPVMNTQAGRTAVADQLLASGLIKDARMYLSLFDGAPLDSLFDTELNENTAVQSEIDNLLEGKPVVPLITDKHPIFIRALLKLLYMQEVRINSELNQQVLEVIMARYQLLQQMDPQLYSMLHGEPYPLAPQMPPGMPQAPQPQQAEPAAETMGMPKQPTAQQAKPTQAEVTI